MLLGPAVECVVCQTAGSDGCRDVLSTGRVCLPAAWLVSAGSAASASRAAVIQWGWRMPEQYLATPHMLLMWWPPYIDGRQPSSRRVDAGCGSAASDKHQAAACAGQLCDGQICTEVSCGLSCSACHIALQAAKGAMPGLLQACFEPCSGQAAGVDRPLLLTGRGNVHDFPTAGSPQAAPGVMPALGSSLQTSTGASRPLSGAGGLGRSVASGSSPVTFVRVAPGTSTGPQPPAMQVTPLLQCAGQC